MAFHTTFLIELCTESYLIIIYKQLSVTERAYVPISPGSWSRLSKIYDVSVPFSLAQANKTTYCY